MTNSATELVGRFYQAMGGELSQISALLADEIDWKVPGSSTVLPWVGPRNNPSDVLQAIRAWIACADWDLLEPEKVVADGDEVMVSMRVRIKAKETGRVIEEDVIDHFSIRDGRIVAFREYYDTASMESAFRA